MVARLSKDGSHYLINGVRYPRLSQMFPYNDGIEAWRKKVGKEEADRIRNETSEFGTKIHRMTMYYDLKMRNQLKKIVECNRSLLPYLERWMEYCEKYIKKWIAIEKVVWSEELGVAGTIDRVDQFMDGQIWIHDIKTGSLYDEIGVRLAGYKIMWEERHPKKRIDRYAAVQLPRNKPGKICVKEYTHLKYEYKFIEVCKLWHKMNG